MTEQEYKELQEINNKYCLSQQRRAMFTCVTEADDFLHDMYIEEGCVLTEQNYSELFHKRIMKFLHNRKIEKGIFTYSTGQGNEEKGNENFNHIIQEIPIYKYCYACNDYYLEEDFTEPSGYRYNCKICYYKYRWGNQKLIPKTNEKRKIEARSQKKARTLLSTSYIIDILKKKGINKDDITEKMIDEKRKLLYEKRQRKKV
jgi:hypothetical protein